MSSKKKEISNINQQLIEKYYGKECSTLEYPNNMLYEYLFEKSLDHPNYIAYEYFGHEVTYQRFIKEIHECAKALKALGINENEVITICTPNMPEAIIMFYAINMIGCIANMIHPLSSENEILNYMEISNSTVLLAVDVVIEKIMHIVTKTKIRHIIVVSPGNNMKMSRKFMYWLAKGRKNKIPISDLIVTWPEFIVKRTEYTGEYIVKKKADDPAIILYSGGTTGKSKGILLSNKNFNALSLQAEKMATPNEKGDVILCILPLFHGFGLGVCVHTALCVGMKCVLIPQFSFKDYKKLIKTYHPNFLVGVPTLFESLTNAKEFKNISFKDVKNVISGGDAMSPELKKRIDSFLEERGSSAKVRVGYGLTESSSACSLSLRDELREHCIGIPFPDMNFKIVKIGTHEEADTFEDGEICINGPTVMLGYVNNEKETMQTLRVHDDGLIWLHTGDIGHKDEEGMIFFEQRLKRLIISSGYNIYPSQIEDILDKHEAVSCSTVIGIPHKYKVQVAKAFIVLKNGYKKNNDTLKSIKEHCEKNISKYALPYEYEFRDSLPKTTVGKISYKTLEEEEIRKRFKN